MKSLNFDNMFKLNEFFPCSEILCGQNPLNIYNLNLKTPRKVKIHYIIKYIRLGS